MHRADVLINNTVIEFQYSPISSEEFEVRNNFYKNCGYRVVWLFNANDKMKIDECFGLVWKRKTTLFSSMKTPIDALFVQNYLPDKNNLLFITQLDSKEVIYCETVYPIMPYNFLKEFGAVNDENVLSIKNIFEKTKEQNDAYNRKKKELEAQKSKAAARRVFNQLTRGGNRRFRRF